MQYPKKESLYEMKILAILENNGQYGVLTTMALIARGYVPGSSQPHIPNSLVDSVQETGLLVHTKDEEAAKVIRNAVQLGTYPYLTTVRLPYPDSPLS